MPRLEWIVGALCCSLAAGYAASQSAKDKPQSGRHANPLPQGAQLWLGSARIRHDDPARSESTYFLGFTADNKQVLSTGEDGTIRAWDVATGRELRRIEKLPNYHQAILSRDGRYVVAAVAEISIKLWDATSFKEVPLFDRQGAAKPKAILNQIGLAFSQDGSVVSAHYFAAGSGCIRLWDTATGKEFPTAPEPADIRGLAVQLSADGKVLALSSLGGLEELTLWNVEAGKQVARFPVQAKEKAISFATDGKRVAMHDCVTNAADVRDMRGGNSLLNLPGIDNAFCRVWFSANGRWLLRSSSRGKEDFRAARIETWELATSKKLADITLPSDLAVYSPEEQFMLTLAMDKDKDNTMALWDLETGKTIGTFAGPPDRQFVNLSMKLSANGKFLALGGMGRVGELWDLTSGKKLSHGHHHPLTCISFAPDGKSVATLDRAGTAQLWDVSTGQILRDIPLPRTMLNPNDQRQIFTLLDETNVQFTDTRKDQIVLNSSNGQALLPLTGLEEHVSALATSADGKWVAAVGTHGQAYLWRRATGKLQWKARFKPEPMDNGVVMAVVTFSPDGGSVAAAGYGSCCVWEVASGKERCRGEWHVPVPQSNWRAGIHFRGPDPNAVTLACFTPDGRFLLLGNDCNLRLWDVFSGCEHRRFGCTGLIGASARLSPDGKFLAACALDGRAYLWDVATATVIGDFRGHESKIVCLEFSPDSQLLITGASDGKALVWNVAEVLRICSRS